MPTFVLTDLPKTADRDSLPPNEGLGSAVLVHNVRWFIRVRWVVVATLILASCVTHFYPALLSTFGLLPPLRWTWRTLAAVLAAANVTFWLLSRPLTEKSPDRVVSANIWLQILVDLVVVTFLVHFVGSTSTCIAFTYLFHIVLACIFFAPAESLLVTLAAAAMYLLCVRMETLGLLSATGMIPLAVRQTMGQTFGMIFATSATLVWLVVWYLVSTLSKIVKERERLLEAANQRLIVADEEKNQLMLCTTHDLKAPFSGIESNIQMLKSQHWDQLPTPAQELVGRIEARGKTLSARISDILLLGDLRTRTNRVAVRETVDIAQILKDVGEELDGQAQIRRVRLQIQTVPLRTQGASRHYFILFSNIVANAISYSREGGTVDVSICRDDQSIMIATQDDGIGISEKALPRIFDEYFRSVEAAQWNPGSTGLGLAIAKEIVQKEGLKIVVTSELGKGTTFGVTIPVERCEFKKENMPWQKS